jgi:hypothetical protein
MGFTTWSFGPNRQDVLDTYAFIERFSDIYVEHIDNRIPWNSWIDDTPLPMEFTDEIAGRADKKIAGRELLLSVSLLNTNRDEIAADFDGTIPAYTNLDDNDIEEAYFKHVQYLIAELQPDYLVISIEANEFRLRAESKWDAYKRLIQKVTLRIKELHPGLPVSESISLHNLFEPEVSDPTAYIDEILRYMNQMDFVAISFYPFLKNQQLRVEFQEAFDFLHQNVNRPIAFVESGHLAEDLVVPAFNLSISGDETQQNTYLETLLLNAQEHDYEFIIWWAHRDFDELWETFPDDLKPLGQLWRDTGLLDAEGNRRPAMETWSNAWNN